MRSRRKLRVNAVYHVTARANHQEFILKTDEAKEMILTVMKQAKLKYRFLLKSFCIMGNHVHLMIQPLGNESLSRIMQWILSVFALRFNRRFNLSGHVWYDRFHSTIIETLRYFLKVFEYIADNPVKAGLCENRNAFRFGALWHIFRGDFSLVEPPGQLLQVYFPELRYPALPGA